MKAIKMGIWSPKNKMCLTGYKNQYEKDIYQTRVCFWKNKTSNHLYKELFKKIFFKDVTSFHLSKFAKIEKNDSTQCC